jgi:hypothetical protein
VSKAARSAESTSSGVAWSVITTISWARSPKTGCQRSEAMVRRSLDKRGIDAVVAELRAKGVKL